MKNTIKLKMLFLFCTILFICMLFFCKSLKSLEQNYTEHGMFDVFQASIGNINMSKYMPKQTVNIKYDLAVKYSLTSLCWYGFVSKEAFETFIKQNLEARKLEEHINFLFCYQLEIPIPKNIVIYTIEKAIIGYDFNKQIIYGQYTSK